MAPIEKTGLERYRRYYRAIEEVAQKPATRIYSSAVFSFLAVSLFGLYAILPTMRTVLFLRREIADKTKINQKMEEKIGNLIEAQAAYEAAGNQLTLVTQAIPTTPQAIELAAQLKNLVQISQASISAIQIPTVPLLGPEATLSASQSPQGNQSDFPVTVILTGPFSSLRSFLDGTVVMRRIVTIDSIRFTPAVGEEVPTGRSAGLKLVLKLKAYYRSL